MANFVSPGVYVIEKDISDYPAQINSSVVGIVGFASRGPIAGINSQKATLVTSQSNLINTFGEPSEYIKGQALEGALEILESTNSMRFVRVADSSRLEASSAVKLGGCPGVMVSGTQSAPIYAEGYRAGDGGFVAGGLYGMSAIGSSDFGTSTVRFTATVYDENRSKIVNAKVYTVPKGTLSTSAATGATTIGALKKVLGGAMDSDRIGAFARTNTLDASSFIVGAAAGGHATIDLKMEIMHHDGTYPTSAAVGSYAGLQGISKIGVPDTLGTSSLIVSGTTADSTAVSYLVTTSGVSFEVGVNGGVNATEQVNNLGVAAETFIAGTTSAAFLENQLGTTYDSRTSNYVTANFADGTYDDTVSVTALPFFEDGMKSLFPGTSTLTGGQGGVTGVTIDPLFVKLVQGTYNLAGGNDGIPTGSTDVAAAVIGAVQADGGKTGIEALDDPILNVSIALAPGPGVGDNQSIQNGLITVAERTTDFLACISPPYAVGTPGDAIDWSNGFATTRTAAVNSSYCAMYWPWLKVFQTFDAKDRWLAPEIYGVRQMAVTDAVADPWFAPAGFVRGRLTKPTDVEVVLNQGDRDSMYSGGNCLNPIVNFPQNGIAIFGQRTTQRQPTALDRINVRRMMIYIKKVILASTQRLVFEPNDKFTWTRVETLINPLMDDILRRRGITELIETKCGVKY